MSTLCGFYKLDNRVLKWDVVKDVEKIQLNHLLMQKENFSRLKSGLPKSQFNTSIHEVSDKLQITKSKATRLIKEFVEIGIIQLIQKGINQKTLSIFQYNTVAEEIEGTMTVSRVEIPPVGVDAPVEDDYIDEYDYTDGNIIEKIDTITAYGITVDLTETGKLDIIKEMSMSTLEYVLGLAKAKATHNKLNYAISTYLKIKNNQDKKFDEIPEPVVDVPVVEDAPVVDAPVVVEEVTAVKDEVVMTKEDFRIEHIGKKAYYDIANGEKVMAVSMGYAMDYAIKHELDVDMVKEYEKNYTKEYAI